MRPKGFTSHLSCRLLLVYVWNLSALMPDTGAIYTAVLYGLKPAPVMIAIVMHICNNKKVMGTNIPVRNGQMFLDQ